MLSEEMYRLQVALGMREAEGFVIPGPPQSKARPRVTRNGTYPPDRKAEQVTGWRLREQGASQRTGDVALVAVFYRPDLRRMDVDNLLKHLLDAGNGILWRDDSQVTYLLGVKALDRERPRTEILVGSIMAVAPGAHTIPGPPASQAASV